MPMKAHTESEGPGAPGEKDNQRCTDMHARAAAILRGGAQRKGDPGRSVAVLCNGLLAIRMGKAPLNTLDAVIPRVA